MTSAPLPILDDKPQYSSLISRPIDNTALSAFTRCPSEYFKGMVLHRRKGGVKPPALAYGTAWHAGKEAYYKAYECDESLLLDQCIAAIEHAWEDHGIADDIRQLSRCILEFKKWQRLSGLPWQRKEKTVGWPGQPAVELNGEVAVPGARHPYAYKIDRIYEDQKQYFVEDHKTTTRFDKNFFRQFELDNQMMGYAYSAQLLTGKPIAGVKISVHVIHKNDSVFDERVISYSQVRLEEWARNYDRWLARIEDHYLEHTRLQLLSGLDPQQIDDAAFPLNFSACYGRKYSSCQYVGICSYPQHLRQRVLEADFEIVPWNPLDAEDVEAVE